MRELIISRRSTRTFQDKPVDKAIIEKIINGASFAPSAKNAQSTEYVVVEDKALLHALAERTAFCLGKSADQLRNPIWRRLYLMMGKVDTEQLARWTGQFSLIAKRMTEGADLILFNAPALILFHGDSRIAFAEANANLAFQNASMIASSLNIGHFYTGYMVAAWGRDKEMRKLLNLPARHRLYAGLALGHPKIRFSKWIDRNPAKVEWR